MTMHWYILDDDNNTIAVTDPHLFYNWERRNEGRRLVDADNVPGGNVSTVLLACLPNPNMLPFETMIFGGPHDLRSWRWASYDQARAGHKDIVLALELGLDPDPKEAA